MFFNLFAFEKILLSLEVEEYTNCCTWALPYSLLWFIDAMAPLDFNIISDIQFIFNVQFFLIFSQVFCQYSWLFLVKKFCLDQYYNSSSFSATKTGSVRSSSMSLITLLIFVLFVFVLSQCLLQSQTSKVKSRKSISTSF